MNTNDKSSIYLSIFKRKGDEGLKTKIVNDQNTSHYNSIFSNLDANERPLLIYFVSNLNWFLLTNSRILISNDGIFSFLYITDIMEVHPALQEEMKDGITDKQKFTKLKIRTRSGDYVVCELEPGKPYIGIYQVLNFIANKNVHRIIKVGNISNNQ